MYLINRKALASTVVIAAAAVSAVAFMTPAQAASSGLASVSGNIVSFRALMGKTNNLTITKSGRVFTLDDTVALQPGKGCKKVDTTKVRCTTPQAGKEIWVALGDKNDKAVNKTGVPMLAGGGAGNDTLLGGPGADTLMGDAGNDSMDGGAGADRLLGHAGNDALSGGLGDDYFDGGPGADTFKGGGGTFDHVVYASRRGAVTADLDGSKSDDGEKGEKDSILHGVEAIFGGKGNDVLTGDKGDDQLVGGPGNDRIFGRAGNDALAGESLDKLGRLIGSAKAADRVDGGEGDDLCLVLAAGRTTTCEFSGQAPLTASSVRITGLDGTQAMIAAAEARVGTVPR